MHLVEGLNWMPFVVFITEVCAAQSHWKRLLMRAWRGKFAERPARDTVSTEWAVDCTVLQDLPKRNGAVCGRLYNLIYLFSLWCKRHKVWLVRKGCGRVEGGRLPGHSCLPMKCTLWVMWYKSERNVEDWFLPSVQMQPYSHSKPQGPLWDTWRRGNAQRASRGLGEPWEQTQR